MPHLIFTQQLARFTAVPQVHSGAARLRAALEDAFTANPALRGYVLDDQGHLRENVVVFIDGRGDSWQLVNALWEVPQRAEWMGGGYDGSGRR